MSNPDDDATKVIFSKVDRSKTQMVGGENSNPAGRPAGDATVFVPASGPATSTVMTADPVVGWLVVAEGPGKGQFRPMFYGQNSVGRDTSMRVSIDFGDSRISREAHAFVVYDEVERKYFVKDNGKSNIVRLNGNMVLTPTEMRDRDKISIGETTLLFVALCDASFDWFNGNAPKTA